MNEELTKEITNEVVIREEAALAFTDSREKLLAVLEDDHLNMEALSDLEIFELFWATELFPIYSQKARIPSGLTSKISIIFCGSLSPRRRV